MDFLSKLKQKMNTSSSSRSEEEGYVELGSEPAAESRGKISVRPYVIEDFEHIKPILDALREGRTIALVNIRPLKDKDLVELKRAINKLKKTCDAIEGDIAGFGEDWIAVVPSFARIHRNAKEKAVKKSEESPEVTEYSADDSQE